MVKTKILTMVTSVCCFSFFNFEEQGSDWQLVTRVSVFAFCCFDQRPHCSCKSLCSVSTYCIHYYILIINTSCRVMWSYSSQKGTSSYTCHQGQRSNACTKWYNYLWLYYLLIFLQERKQNHWIIFTQVSPLYTITRHLWSDSDI